MLALRSATCAVLLMTVGLPFGDRPAEAEPVNFRLSVETPEGEPLNYILRAFQDALTERAGEEVTTELFDGGVLGDEIAQMELVRAGEVDVVPLGSDVVEIEPKFSLFDAPFLFPSKDAARKALDGALGERLADALMESSGLKVLAFGELGYRVISNNVRPITTPEDLQGLKLRTPGSATRIMAFEKLGAAPTPMNLGEVYLALKQGALDGQENPLSVIKEMSFHEVQNYISLTRHVYTPITLVMNGAKWEELSPELQEMVLEAAAEAREASRTLSDESDASLLGEFEAAGVEINDADLDAFKAKIDPIYEEIGQIVGPDFMEQAVADIEGST